MDTETMAPSETEPVATPTETTPADVETPAESIADHAAQFQPDAQQRVAQSIADARREQAATQRREPASGQFQEGRVKHRAQSQQASAEDVKAINELTKELRTKEAELAKVRPDESNESPRLKALRRQIKAIEADLAEAQPKPAPATMPAASARSTPPSEPAPAGTFTDKEPDLNDFLDQPDPYASWVKEWNRWDRKRERAEDLQRTAAEARVQAERDVLTKHQQRMTTFAQQTPDFTATTQALMGQMLPTPLLRAIAEDDNGPAFVYHLAQHPALVDDLTLLAYGRDAADDQFVATLQRRLAQHVAAVKTGSAPVPRTYTPPKPPNPVRTGSVQTADEPPGEGSSIADHARYYGPQARR